MAKGHKKLLAAVLAVCMAAGIGIVPAPCGQLSAPAASPKKKLYCVVKKGKKKVVRAAAGTYETGYIGGRAGYKVILENVTITKKLEVSGESATADVKASMVKLQKNTMINEMVVDGDAIIQSDRLVQPVQMMKIKRTDNLTVDVPVKKAILTRISRNFVIKGSGSIDEIDIPAEIVQMTADIPIQKINLGRNCKDVKLEGNGPIGEVNVLSPDTVVINAPVQTVSTSALAYNTTVYGITVPANSLAHVSRTEKDGAQEVSYQIQSRITERVTSGVKTITTLPNGKSQAVFRETVTDASGTVQPEVETVLDEDGAVTSVLVKNPDASGIYSTVKSMPIDEKKEALSTEHFLASHHGWVSPLSTFYDDSGNFNIACDGENEFSIMVLSTELNRINTLTIPKKYPKLGGVAYYQGCYYAVYGIPHYSKDENNETLSIVKYGKDGSYVAEAAYNGWGTDTWKPFAFGNCDIAFSSNGMLACNYAQIMYSGHQSNHVVYVDTATMQKVNTARVYTSHSWDQRVIWTKDGSFLFADQGDAHERGFNITKLYKDNAGTYQAKKIVPFHFREGTDWKSGYNTTFAQLGGIAECGTGYVLAASSEKTLSLDATPGDHESYVWNEARNLFVQILKKDFAADSGPDCFAVAGQMRKAVGSRRHTDSGTEFWLKGDETDYGVLWLTDYEDAYYCASPKVIVTEDDRIILLWEKHIYMTTIGFDPVEEREVDNVKDTFIDSYIMVLKNDGTVLQEVTSLGGVRLDANENVIYKDGMIMWASAEKKSKEQSVIWANVLSLK